MKRLTWSRKLFDDYYKIYLSKHGGLWNCYLVNLSKRTRVSKRCSYKNCYDFIIIEYSGAPTSVHLSSTSSRPLTHIHMFIIIMMDSGHSSPFKLYEPIIINTLTTLPWWHFGSIDYTLSPLPVCSDSRHPNEHVYYYASSQHSSSSKGEREIIGELGQGSCKSISLVVVIVDDFRIRNTHCGGNGRHCLAYT